jgi:hypothetical protein
MFFYFWGTGRSGHVCDFHQGIANLQGSSAAAPWLFQNFAPKPQLYETRFFTSGVHPVDHHTLYFNLI